MTCLVVLLRVESLSLLSVRLLQMVISVHLLLMGHQLGLLMQGIVKILAMIDIAALITT